jgi:hypothetical protein
MKNLDARQTELRAAQPMIGNAANDTLDTVIPKIDAELAKLFEDRNVQLTDGGTITFNGTSATFTEALKLHINSQVAGGSPTVISLGSTTRSFSASGRMLYAIVDRIGSTATIFADQTTLPAVTSANEEVFLIAKRVDTGSATPRLYFRDGTALTQGDSQLLGAGPSSSGGGGTSVELIDILANMKKGGLEATTSNTQLIAEAFDDPSTLTLTLAKNYSPSDSTTIFRPKYDLN